MCLSTMFPRSLCLSTMLWSEASSDVVRLRLSAIHSACPRDASVCQFRGVRFISSRGSHRALNCACPKLQSTADAKKCACPRCFPGVCACPRSLVRLCLSAVRIATPSPRAHSALLTTGKSALWGSVFAVWGDRSKVIYLFKQLFCRRAAHAERVVVAAMCCDRPQRETLRRSQRTRAGM